MPKIVDIRAIEVLDSKNSPTIQTTVFLEDGSSGTFTAPSGASVGKAEALDLKNEVGGKLTVSLAISNLVNIILPGLKGKDALDQPGIDALLLSMDASKNKSNLGGNTIISVSGAVAVAAAKSRHLPLYRYLNQLFRKHHPTSLHVPQPMFLMLEGGVHGLFNFDFQEILLVVNGMARIFEAQVAAKQVFYFLEEILAQAKIEKRYGMEGALSPLLKSNQQALEFLNSAIKKTAFSKAGDLRISLDCAASEFKTTTGYRLKDFGGSIPAAQLLTFYQDITRRYELLSLEDPFEQEDIDSWKKMANMTHTTVIGDDLTVTNRYLLEQAINNGIVSGVIIKPNQVGTLTETFQTVALAKEKNLKVIASHRSGETTDTFISDLAVAIGADFIKAGGLMQKVRQVKYDRLIQIEKEIYS